MLDIFTRRVDFLSVNYPLRNWRCFAAKFSEMSLGIHWNFWRKTVVHRYQFRV